MATREADKPLSPEVAELLNDASAARLEELAHQKLMGELYEEMIEASPRGHIVIDNTGKVTYINRSAEQMFGWIRSELLGKQIELLVPPDLREKHIKHRARYANDPRLRPMGIGLDAKGLRKSGELFPINVMLSALTVSTGTYYRAIVSPIVEELATPRPRDEAPEGPKILIVEDNDLVAETIVGILTDARCQTVLAATGQAAITRLESDEEYDLAIIDLGLQDMNGAKLAELIRARGNQVPMIALSGMVSSVRPEVLSNAGFVATLEKPVRVDALLQAIAEHARKPPAVRRE